MMFSWGILVCVTFSGFTDIIQAVTVSWLTNAVTGFSTMYINGVHTADVGGGWNSRPLPADARVMAWKFSLNSNTHILHRNFRVRYTNGWTSNESDCWKCTEIDVSQENWPDIDYDDSAWAEPVIVYGIVYSWIPGPRPLTIWCRHKLPVSDLPEFELSNNRVMPVAVAEKMKDENTGTCVQVSEIYGAAMITGIKVYSSSLYTGGLCALKLNITGLGLECNRLRVYTEAADTGSQCPKNGPTSRLAVTSQGPGSNGTVWCQFEYVNTPADCATCCVACDKPVLLVFRASDAHVSICEIHHY